MLVLQSGYVLKEHRIRYLCFLGIAKDDHFCGYILESGQRMGEKCFRFYGFRMEPNTDRLCLALHAACQARYKRVQETNTRQHSQQQQWKQQQQQQQQQQQSRPEVRWCVWSLHGV